MYVCYLLFLPLSTYIHLLICYLVSQTERYITFFEHKARTVALLLKRETTEFIINCFLHLCQKSPESDDFSFYNCLTLKLSKQELIHRLQSLDFVFKVCRASLLLLPVLSHCLSVPTWPPLVAAVRMVILLRILLQNE